MNIYDVAKRAGVSIATVSRVINNSSHVSEKTRRRVTQVMNELGYTPNVFARGLMVNSIKILGVMAVDVRDLYFAEAIHTISVESGRRGYDVLLCSTGREIEDKRKYLKLLLEKRVDGIILVGSVFKEKGDNSHIIDAAGKVPIVMINALIEGENIYSIVCDDSYAVRVGVDHLVGRGHRNIAYIYDVDTFSGMNKLKGFKEGMAERGLDSGDEMVIKTESGIEGGYAAAGRLLEMGKSFSAIITAEDILAVGVMKRLREEGLSVPEDVAVIGFNNSTYSRCTEPELTSVDNKVVSMSSLAVKTLIDAIEGNNLPSKTVITPELVIRGTT